MPIGAGLPNQATLLFNGPIRVLLPQINREPININADDKGGCAEWSSIGETMTTETLQP